MSREGPDIPEGSWRLRALALKTVMKPAGRRGFTLFEVILAAMIMILALIPLLRALGTSARVADNAEKVQVAQKVLQSIKDELVAVKFMDFHAYAKKMDVAGKANNGEYELDDMFFPGTYDNLLQLRKKYPDLTVAGTFKFVTRTKNPRDRSVIFVQLQISWEKGKHKLSDSLTLVDSKT